VLHLSFDVRRKVPTQIGPGQEAQSLLASLYHLGSDFARLQDNLSAE
jgi:hypothetical protein